MASNGLRINGLGELLAQLKELPDKMAQEIDMEIDASCDTMVRDMKRAAPKDLGNLVNGISKKKIALMERELISAAPYSAYQEFGTRSKVQIPAGYEDFAAQFKGQKGPGTLVEFLEHLTEWVRLKGLAGTYSVKTKKRTGNKAVQADENKSLAYVIMRSILKNGVNPHPFFIPAIEKEKPLLLARIKKLVTG